MNDKDYTEYDNQEEAEIAQIANLNANANAVNAIRRQLAAQAAQPSAELCEDCGESIPEQRRQMIPGVQRCVTCQDIWERRRKMYGSGPSDD